MPEVTSHAHGTPSWADLATTNESLALSFYRELFGWIDEPQPMGENSYYHMQKLNGLEAAAIYQQMEEESNQGIPSHWTVYFTVDDADAAAGKAAELGGTVLMGPMDVFEAGRMALVQDPQGAVFSVWQPKQHIGARVKDDPGAMPWNELLTTDPDASTEFYGALFGMERVDTTDMGGYILLRVQGTEVAGLMKITEDMGPVPPCWTVYFAVEDVSGAVADAQEMGAEVVVPATDIPEVGRFAALTDPMGAHFSIFKGS